MSYNQQEFSLITHKSPPLIPWYSLALFLLSAIGGGFIWFDGLNQEIFLAINHQHAVLPNDVWLAFNMLSYNKYFILPTLLLIATALLRRDKFINVILLIGAYFVVFATLKHLIGEARPYITLPQDSFFWLNQYENAVKSAHLSFPSGHTGNVAIFAFGLNYLIFANKKWLQFLMLMLVLMVAFARICTGWHWPLDVLASSLIGYVLVKITLPLNLNNLFRKKEYVRY